MNRYGNSGDVRGGDGGSVSCSSNSNKIMSGCSSSSNCSSAGGDVNRYGDSGDVRGGDVVGGDGGGGGKWKCGECGDKNTSRINN